jgi:hypothetical protein
VIGKPATSTQPISSTAAGKYNPNPLRSAMPSGVASASLGLKSSQATSPTDPAFQIAPVFLERLIRLTWTARDSVRVFHLA